MMILSGCITTHPLMSEKNIEVFNREIKFVKEGKREILTMNEQKAAGVAWLKNIAFTEGIIEFDAKGRDIPQKSFIGIAFHGINDSTYETVYFRPFNFQSTDPVKHIHSVQYTFEPLFDFQRLRDARKDEFESSIHPPSIQATDWFHVKIEVRGDRVRVYINGETKATLAVKSLNPNPSGRKIGYWVGNNSNGDFANFNISKLP